MMGYRGIIRADVIYSTQNTPEKRELSTQAATAVELPPNLTLADRAVLDTFLAPQPPSPECEWSPLPTHASPWLAKQHNVRVRLAIAVVLRLFRVMCSGAPHYIRPECALVRQH